jgi:shikimate dehydrogenase
MTMINGNTRLIAHIGYPTSTFKAPMIYNPYFESIGADAVVIPMGVRAEDLESAFRTIFRFSNIHGALVTMPHKVTVMALLDEVSTTAQIAGSCNAILLRSDGRIIGDMFDGEGFVRCVRRKGRTLEGASVLVVGTGGVGSAIAASLAAADVARICLFDLDKASMLALAGRLRHHYPALEVVTGSNDPAGFDVVVNATPLGMNPGDPMPLDVSRLSPSTFVGEVVMKSEMTAFLSAAQARGCQIQVGIDMLFEQIPAYLEFFGMPTTTPDALRAVAQISY